MKKIDLILSNWKKLLKKEIKIFYSNIEKRLINLKIKKYFESIVCFYILYVYHFLYDLYYLKNFIFFNYYFN